MGDIERDAQQVEQWLAGGSYQDWLVQEFKRVIETASADPDRIRREASALPGVRVDRMQVSQPDNFADPLCIELVFLTDHEGETLEITVNAIESMSGGLGVVDMHLERSIRF